MNTIFSHRPLAGVSAGAFDQDGRLFVAFALVNDGTSRNGFVWPERRDTFCRATARSIINGRIASALAGNAVPLTLSFETDLTARQFIAAFRETFKPTTDETDSFLADVLSFGVEDEGVELRIRPMAADIVDRLETLTREIVSNAGSRV